MIDRSAIHDHRLETCVRFDAPATGHSRCERLVQNLNWRWRDWALGVDAYARALLSDGQKAELLYRDAIDRVEPHPRARDVGPRPPALR
jgi:hypothetical protein